MIALIVAHIIVATMIIVAVRPARAEPDWLSLRDRAAYNAWLTRFERGKARASA